MMNWRELFKGYSKHDIEYSKHDIEYSMEAMISALEIVILCAKLCNDKERFITVMTNTLNSIKHDLEEVKENEKETI